MHQYVLSRTQQLNRLDCIAKNVNKCDQLYDRRVLYDMMGNHWVLKYYTNYRKMHLFLEQKARFPETMTYISCGNRVNEMYNLYQTLLPETNARKEELKKEELKEEGKKLEEYSLELNNIMTRDNIFYDRTVHRMLRHMHEYISISDKQKKTVKKLYFGHCSQEDCNGLIRKNGMCDICKCSTCTKCFITRGPNHMCNPETIKTIKLIHDESKPCPGCGTSVQKVSGCYQMWCIMCHVLFDWSTREILNEKPHNPHYLEWASKNGINVNDRHYGGCGIIDICKNIILSGDNPTNEKLMDRIPCEDLECLLFSTHKIYQFYYNLDYQCRWNMRWRIRYFNKKMYLERRKFLIGLCDKKEFLKNIMKLDKEFERYSKFVDTSELLMTGITSLSNDCHDKLNVNVKIDLISPIILEYVHKVVDLCILCNNLYYEDGYIYGNVFPSIKLCSNDNKITYITIISTHKKGEITVPKFLLE